MRLLTADNGVKILKEFTTGHTHVLHNITANVWYPLKQTGKIANTSEALVANRLYFVPFFVVRAFRVTQLGVKIEATGGTKIRLGVYSNQTSGNDRPYERLIQTGNLSTSPTGIKSASISFNLEPGVLYWYGIASDGNPLVKAEDIIYAGSMLGWQDTENTMISALYQNLSAGWSELPATASASACESSNIPLVFAKLEKI